MLSKRIYDSQKIWNRLNGVINVYKPRGVKVNHVRAAIISNICQELNKLKVRSPRYRVNIETATHNQFKVKVEEDLADSILVVGERYQNVDVKCVPAATLGERSSGVLLFGLNDGTKQTTQIHKNRPIRVYHITGQLGTSTETNFSESRITSRSTFHHISHEKINSLLSSMQASHQKKMFELCGVDLQTQAAYELAIKGTIRPDSFKIPVLYGIKCISYNRPEFELEVHAINENEDYLGILVHGIGLQLHTVAHCKAIRCIRHGDFNIEDSLLRRNWNLESISKNLVTCRQILRRNPHMLHNTHSELI